MRTTIVSLSRGFSIIGEAFCRGRWRDPRERPGLLAAGDQARVRRRHAGDPRCAVIGQRLREQGRIVPAHRPRGLFVPQGIRVRHREHHAVRRSYRRHGKAPTLVIRVLGAPGDRRVQARRRSRHSSFWNSSSLSITESIPLLWIW